MKKLFIVLVILIVLAALWLLVERDGSNDVDTDNSAVLQDENGAFKPNPSEATFVIEGETITLSNGKNERSVSPESALIEETVLLDINAYGDINADDEEDTAVFIVQSGGGSGVFVYVAAFVSGPVGYRGTNAVYLGDRVSPQSISIDNGVITLRYLDRNSDEPFAAEPTVSVSKSFIYTGNKLEEK